MGRRDAGATGAAAVATSAGADALLLRAVGGEAFGLALAASNVLLMLVLVGVGALADRVDRRRLLVGLTTLAAGALVVIDVAQPLAPVAAAAVWSAASSCCRRSSSPTGWRWPSASTRARARWLPRLLAAGGTGAALGAVLVVAVAERIGPQREVRARRRRR
ncbi:MAG: hypothetical protein R2939_14050 [Kofleriaceae bacterium]